ncbi:MAG: trypsin-like serine protease [Ruminococcus sp.]|nr:trypsin-like serine protease [Ruminococcus sp.]
MKKVLKKIINVSAVSFLSFTLAGSVVPFSASAYDSRDINRDGVVNILDVVSFNKYLSGQNYTASLASLDVDGNSIIDYADSMCIMAGVSELDYYSQIEGLSKKFKARTVNSTINKTVSSPQKYTRCICKTKKTDTYTLQAGSAVSTMATDNSKIHGIIGIDNRTQDYLGGIVNLRRSENDRNLGTGFIVGDHVIATSAHCVYEQSTSTWVEHKIRLYNNDGTPSNTILDPVEVHIPNNYFNRSGVNEYDYALIVVKEDLKNYYHFNLGMPYNVYNNTNFLYYNIYTTGFSGEIPGGTPNSNPAKMYTGEGKIVKTNLTTDCFYHSADCTYGNSGGPVYIKNKYTTGSTEEQLNTVVSFCSRMHLSDDPSKDAPYNFGPTMIPVMLRFYLSNDYVLQTIDSFS